MIAAAVAVAPPAVRLLIALSTVDRSAVGDTRTCAVLLNDNNPTFNPGGTAATKFCAAATAAARRDGATSVAAIEPEVSIASMMIPRCFGTF